MKSLSLFIIAMALTAALHGQVDMGETSSQKEMNTYLIERNIPNAGDLKAADLKGISQKSCDVIKIMGPNIEWLHSYVTQDKVYCIYRAKDEGMIREHAEKGGFPANKISLLSNTISPETAK